MRTRYPGAKFDHILALVGAEGLGKSELCRVLAIRDEWYLEGFKLTWDEKKLIEQTAGIVIAEYGEMAGHSQKDQAALKDAASRSKDKARKAYGRFAETRRRSFVPIANTNEVEHLISKYGNRRFWPLHIKKAIDTYGLREVRDQLYGEAVHAQEDNYAEFGTRVVLDEAHWAYFAGLQEHHRVKAPIESRVQHVMDGIDEGHLLAVDLYDALEIKHNDRMLTSDAEHAMKLLKWRKDRLRMPGAANPQTYFLKGKSPEAQRIARASNTQTGRCELMRCPPKDAARSRSENIIELRRAGNQR
jgi:predicted P-loop ATPase